MARHKKLRLIQNLPEYEAFTPNGIPSCQQVVLSLDEYECIYLMDYKKMTQLECASQMNVSRTTITEIYDKARFKLADAIVNGKPLVISGGHVQLAKTDMTPQFILKNKGEEQMRIAVTYENGQIFQHFGRTQYFKLYDVENGKVVSQEVVSSNGQGHGALAYILQGNKVDALICGGIGGGAKSALANVNITLYGGCSGDCDKAVEDLLNNNLNYNADIECDHHDHHDGHDCSSHDCGSHDCGTIEMKLVKH